MSKIALILPYFGKVRNDFKFWLKSVEFNSTIDFLIFTDQAIVNVPSNVKLFHTNLQFVEKLAKKYVLQEAIINTPQKLCDFKPAYGQIFQDYLCGYDFWGHCDCDLIFGNIRHFLTEDILNKYNRILSRGHLTLYRNIKEVNTFYEKCKYPNYREVFCDSKLYCFDEWGGTSRAWKNDDKDKFYDNIIFDDIKTFVYSFHSAQKQKLEIGRKNFMFTFNKGKLLRYFEENNFVYSEETCYVHFQKRHLKIKTEISDRFIIVPNSFVRFEDNITLSYLRKNVRTSHFWPYLERIKQKTFKYLGIKENRAYLTLFE